MTKPFLNSDFLGVSDIQFRRACKRIASINMILYKIESTIIIPNG